ncbi:MAG TPA: SCO family protein [Thermoanaerobaculia bacterium]|nr:SCO family protein [Thermoanaerobaculia bacterium]
MIKQIGLSLAIASAFALQAQQNSSTPPQLPGKVAVVQHLGAQLPMNEMFRDDTGRVVRLGDYFKSGRPVLLDFMYYRCPMLCSMVLEGTTSALTELKLDIGKDFDVITVSIDPRDMPDDARVKKEKYVKRYGRPSAYEGWHFLTSHESAIKHLTDTVGFQYAYDPKSDQFAHGTVLIAVTPQGKVSKYFYGFEYKPRDVRLGLVEASAGTVGTPVDQLLLLCFHYSPSTGKYSAVAMDVMRAGGAATILGLGGFIFVMVRKERRNGIRPQ